MSARPALREREDRMGRDERRMRREAKGMMDPQGQTARKVRRASSAMAAKKSGG